MSNFIEKCNNHCRKNAVTKSVSVGQKVLAIIEINPSKEEPWHLASDEP